MRDEGEQNGKDGTGPDEMRNHETKNSRNRETFLV